MTDFPFDAPVLIAFALGALVSALVATALHFASHGKSSDARKFGLAEYRLARELSDRENLEKPLAVAHGKAEKESEWMAANRSILAAINGNEFALMSQRIVPLPGSASGPEHREVLIRLLEEESGLIPPGAFFPLAEEHGLLPQLDRWVLSKVLETMMRPGNAPLPGSLHFINVSRDTLHDQDFPAFAADQLRRTGLDGARVCLEISEVDLVLNPDVASSFAHAIRQLGCRIAISGFGRDFDAMALLKRLPVDFLKIDGGIVRQLARYPVPLGRAAAIVKLAAAAGIGTIAEMVEDDATLAKVRDLGLGFAQGFWISRPAPLWNVPVPVHELAGQPLSVPALQS